MIEIKQIILCMHVCTPVCKCVHIPECMCVCTCVCIAHVCAHARVCICIYLYELVCSCLSAYVSALGCVQHICVYVHVCAPVCKCVYACVHVHVCAESASYLPVIKDINVHTCEGKISSNPNHGHVGCECFGF